MPFIFGYKVLMSKYYFSYFYEGTFKKFCQFHLKVKLWWQFQEISKFTAAWELKMKVCEGDL
jgi:hypothetical protein